MKGDGCATKAEIAQAYPELTRAEIANAIDSLAFEGFIVRCTYHPENYIVTPRGIQKWGEHR